MLQCLVVALEQCKNKKWSQARSAWTAAWTAASFSCNFQYARCTNDARMGLTKAACLQASVLPTELARLYNWSPMLLDTRTVRSSSELSELSGCRPGCLGAVRLVWVVFGLFGHVRTLPPLSGWHPNYPDGDWTVRVCPVVE